MIELDDHAVSEGYLELTLRALRQAGFRLERLRSSLELLGWDAPSWEAQGAKPPEIPRDWSAIGPLLLIAWKTGGSVAGLDLAESHPDRAIVEHLRSVGLDVSRDNGVGETRVVGQLRRGFRASAAKTPDLMPALAALACLLPDTSTMTEVSRLRSKARDRLQAIVDLVAAGGASSHLEADRLRIEPAPQPPLGAADPLRLDGRDDHRMIMAAATLAVLLGRQLDLTHGSGVEKSFPGFFGQLALAGIELC